MTQRFPIAVTLLLALVASAPAFAQITQPPPTRPGEQRPERPNTALFGGGYGNTAQRLILNASLGAGYEDDMRPPTSDIGLPAGARPPRTGVFGLGSAALTYTVDQSRVAGSLYAGAYGRYYTGMTGPLVGTYSGGGLMTFKLASRSSLSVNGQAGVFQQNAAAFSGTGGYGFGNGGYGLGTGGYGLGTVPGMSVDPTAFASGDTYTGLRGGAEFTQNLTTRLAFNAGYHYYTSDAWSAAGSGRYAVQTGRAGLSFEMARGLSLRLGYSASDGRFATATPDRTPYRGRSFDGGIDFNRSLSLTRRSTLTFGTGVTGFSDRNLNTRYYATGHLDFGYEIGRSWTANLGYQRTANMVQTFGQPAIVDSVSVGVGGLISQRVQLSTSAGAFRGTVGITAGAPHYTAGTAGIGLQFALTRLLALGVGYSYYQYQFDSGVPLPRGMLPRMERQSVRVSLDLWAPLVTRARRPNAAR